MLPLLYCPSPGLSNLLPLLQRFRTMGFKTIVSDLKAIFLAVPSRSERDTATSRRHFPRME
ncbi:MAG: hypothetical protein AB1813_07650, partial [Verrucomicrobiota bacterium]